MKWPTFLVRKLLIKILRLMNIQSCNTQHIHMVPREILNLTDFVILQSPPTQVNMAENHTSTMNGLKPVETCFCTIVIKSDNRKIRLLVGLLLANICPKHIFQHLINPFSLTITLWMISCTKVQHSTQLTEYGSPKMAIKLENRNH